MAKVPSDNVPYPSIFVYVGLLFWQFFLSALGETSSVLITTNQSSPKSTFPPHSAYLIGRHQVCRLYGCLGNTCLNDGLRYGYLPHLKGLLIIFLLLLIIFMASRRRRSFLGGRLMSSISRCPLRPCPFHSNSSFPYSCYLSRQHCVINIPGSCLLIPCDRSHPNSPGGDIGNNCHKLDTAWHIFLNLLYHLDYRNNLF